jgi:hypothetical protein
MGLRDYAIFLLIATYGLRASEIVAIGPDDIRWRQGNLRIHQRKTSSPLELPLTNEVSAALVKHLQQTPPPASYRRIFLRIRAAIGLLKPTTVVTEAFQALVRKSGLELPFHGPHLPPPLVCGSVAQARIAADHCNNPLPLAFVQQCGAPRPFLFIECALEAALLVTMPHLPNGLRRQGTTSEIRCELTPWASCDSAIARRTTRTC